MKKLSLLALMIFTLVFNSCLPGGDQITIDALKATPVDTAEGSCPYLTEDNKGNPVLTWIRKKDAASSVFCYAVSENKGKTFGNPIEIPGSANVHPHGENMPKIIFKADGGIIAVWPAAHPNPLNPYSDILFYSQSFDQGHTWTRAEKLVADSAGFDQRYFDMALLGDGEVGISWLDNRKKTTAEGSALYFAETRGNTGFQGERLVSEPCCPCCRTALFVDSKENIHILYRAIISDSIRDMVHMVSADQGKTFSVPERISRDNWAINGCPHTGPAMTENKNGIQFAWFTGGGDAGTYYCHSADEGKTFSTREMVSGVGSRHCQISTVGDGQVAIVWNENFLSGKESSSRIGMEIRDRMDGHPVKAYLTPQTGDASFPVIRKTGENTALVAYTENAQGKDQVVFMQVHY